MAIEKSIDLSNLKTNKSGHIDWINSIGSKCNFVYDGVSSWFILERVDDNALVTISGEFKEHYKIKKDHIKKCELRKFVGLSSKEYKYSKGDKIKTLKVIKPIRLNRRDRSWTEKGYLVMCEKCGYESEVFETKLSSGNGCACCSGDICVTGVNDVATTHPHLVKYFKNKNDAMTHSYSSNVRVLVKCINCGMEKLMMINNLHRKGLSCCGDGISYPNKFIFNMLIQLSVVFETEYSPKWANGRRYDFYIPSKNLIIEADGGLHVTYNNRNEQSVEVTKSIDLLKDEMANKNKIDVIRIDCLKSDMNYIKANILSSKLIDVFNIDHVNWSECNYFASSNRAKEVKELWDNGVKNIKKLKDITQLSDTTIRRYLKMMNADYDPRIGNKRKIKIIDTGEIFNSIQEAIDVYGTKGIKLDSPNILAVCNGRRYSHRGYKFKYAD